MPASDSTSPLTVIVPVYNEADYILEVLRRVQANPLVRQIVVVDDASKDGTRQLLRRVEGESVFAQQNNLRPEAITFVFQEINQGKGAALRTGISHATSPLTLIQDADFEYDPKEYGRLIQPLLDNEADVVYGSRFAGAGGGFSWHTFGNKVLTAVSNLFTGLRLTDMETCYKVFRTDLIQSIPLRSNRFGFEPEVTAKVAQLKCRVREIPISYQGRSYTEGKKIGWKDGVSAIWTILKFWVLRDVNRNDASPSK